MSPREIEKHTGISRLSVRRMVKRKDIERIMKRRDWMFIQGSAPLHRSNLVQDFLTENIDRRFIKHNKWPPSSSDSNPLDYYFWDKIKDQSSQR